MEKHNEPTKVFEFPQSSSPSKDSKTKLPNKQLWDQMCKYNGFKLKGVLGQGSCGTVMKVSCRETKNKYAIKLIQEPFHNLYTSRQLLREIKILRKLTDMNSNIYTTKIHDIIIANEAIVH